MAGRRLVVRYRAGGHELMKHRSTRRTTPALVRLAGAVAGSVALVAIAAGMVFTLPYHIPAPGLTPNSDQTPAADVGMPAPSATLGPTSQCEAKRARRREATDATTTPMTEPTPTVDPEASRLRAIEMVNADPDNFGGAYIDDAGVLVIQYLGANAGRSAVESVLPAEVPVRWEKVELSQRELLRILEEISHSMPDTVSSVGLDTVNNRVEVRLASDDHRSDLTRQLSEKYRAAVWVNPDPHVFNPLPALPTP